MWPKPYGQKKGRIPKKTRHIWVSRQGIWSRGIELKKWNSLNPVHVTMPIKGSPLKWLPARNWGMRHGESNLPKLRTRLEHPSKEFKVRTGRSEISALKTASHRNTRVGLPPTPNTHEYFLKNLSFHGEYLLFWLRVDIRPYKTRVGGSCPILSRIFLEAHNIPGLLKRTLDRMVIESIPEHNAKLTVHHKTM